MITISHELTVSLQLAWQAWATQTGLSAWDPDRIDGKIREGEEVVMHWDSLGVSICLKVQELLFEEAIVFCSKQEDGSSQELRVGLRAVSTQVTAITLSLSGEMSEDEQEGSAAGWHTQLRILERYLSLDPKPRSSFAALGTAVVPLASAYDALSHPGRWLCHPDIHFEQEAQRFAMTTRPSGQDSGVSLSGDVISLIEGRELALWCTELGGIIRMRAIALAGGRARLVGVQVIRWGEVPAALDIERALRAGVDRLIGAIGGPSGTA